MLASSHTVEPYLMTLLLCESDQSCYSGPYTAHFTDTIWTRTAQMNEARYWGRKHALCMTNPSQSSLGSRGIENLRFKFSQNTVPPSHLITFILVTCNVILSICCLSSYTQYIKHHLPDHLLSSKSVIKFGISFVIICILSLHLMLAINVNWYKIQVHSVQGVRQKFTDKSFN